MGVPLFGKHFHSIYSLKYLLSFGEMFTFFLLIDLSVKRKFLFAKIFKKKNRFYVRKNPNEFISPFIFFCLTMKLKLQVVKTQNVYTVICTAIYLKRHVRHT